MGVRNCSLIQCMSVVWHFPLELYERTAYSGRCSALGDMEEESDLCYEDEDDSEDLEGLEDPNTDVRSIVFSFTRRFTKPSLIVCNNPQYYVDLSDPYN